AELVDVDIDGTGVDLHLGAVDLHLLGGDGLLDAAVRRELAHGDDLFLAAFGRFVLLVRGLRLLGRFGRFGRLFGRGGGFRLLFFLLFGLLCLFGGGLGFRLFAGGQILVQAFDGGLAGQRFEQAVDLAFLNRAAGFA